MKLPRMAFPLGVSGARTQAAVAPRVTACTALLLLAVVALQAAPGLLLGSAGTTGDTSDSPRIPEPVLFRKLQQVDVQQAPSLHAGFGQAHGGAGDATSPDARIAVLCDLGEAHARSGDAAKSIACLQEALQMLHSSEVVSLSKRSRARLAGKLYRRVLSINRINSHMRETLRATTSAIPASIPGETSARENSKTVAARAVIASERVPISLGPIELQDLVKELMNLRELKKADATVVAALKAYYAKGDRVAAAVAYNLLGWVRRAQERYPEAARRHLQALSLTLQACGPDAAGSPMAEAAYQGLSLVQAYYDAGTPEKAKALLHEAKAAADAAGVSQDEPGRLRGERLLRADAQARNVVAALARNVGGFSKGMSTELQDLVRDQRESQRLARSDAKVAAALAEYRAEKESLRANAQFRADTRLRRSLRASVRLAAVMSRAAAASGREAVAGVSSVSETALV